MRVARPVFRRAFSRCLAGASCSTSSTLSSPPCQQQQHHTFHSSSPLAARRRARFSNLRAVEMGLVNEQKINQFAKSRFPEYSCLEKQANAAKYSPEQLAAIDAGERAIDPRDLAVQGRLRLDPYRLPYIESFRNLRPTIDKRPRTKPPPDVKAHFMNEEEFMWDFRRWAIGKYREAKQREAKMLVDFVPDEFKKVPEEKWPRAKREEAEKQYATWVTEQREKEERGEHVLESPAVSDKDLLEYLLDRSAMTGGDAGSQTALAPALPNKVPGVAGLYKTVVDPDDEGKDPSGQFKELKRKTSLSMNDIQAIRTKTLVLRWVSNQTRLGKVQRTSIMVLAGNRNGWIGLGMAKSVEQGIAFEKARMLAISNMRPIPRYENRTVFGNVEAKVGATVVKLSARPPGFGLRASHRIFEICRAAGLQDIAAKMPRARNPMNSVKATFQALFSQRNPEDIALGRGKKLVDVRKVYYGGAVY